MTRIYIKLFFRLCAVFVLIIVGGCFGAIAAPLSLLKNNSNNDTLSNKINDIL